MRTVTRKRIEVLIDAPLVPLLAEAAEASGVTGYTVLPTLGGKGRSGIWREDQLTGAANKVMFVTIATEAKANALVDALTPLLDQYGIVLAIGDVQVVRGGRF